MTIRFPAPHHLDGVRGHLAASGLIVASTLLPGVTAGDLRYYLAVVGDVIGTVFATKSAHQSHRTLQ